MTQKSVALLDYGAGNLRSAQRALEHVGANVTVTSDPKMAVETDGLLVPGVGAFAACMAGLKAIHGPRIIGQRLAGGRPVLGICVGMQVLFDAGKEHGIHTDGCGEWPGTVECHDSQVLPHMGWNAVVVLLVSELFACLDDDTRFYYVLSYGARRWELETEITTPPLATWSQHEQDPFVAAVENGPLWATQFHPEKSGDAGLQLLENWLKQL